MALPPEGPQSAYIVRTLRRRPGEVSGTRTLPRRPYRPALLCGHRFERRPLCARAGDDDVQPNQAAGGEEREHGEAALDLSGRLLQVAEGERQEEPTEGTQRAHEAAHQADVTGIVLRDVLVDGGLADAHAGSKPQCASKEAP